MTKYCYIAYFVSILVQTSAFLSAGEPLLKQSVDIPIPFATDSVSHRAYKDYPIEDPGLTGRIESILVEFQCADPQAVGSLTIFFHSENGWYSHSNVKYHPVAGKPNTFRGMLLPGNFRVEGEPGPWSKIDKVRIAFNRGRDIDTVAKVTRLENVVFSTLVVLPGDTKAAKATQALADRMSRMGIENGTVSTKDFSEAALQGRRVVFLPNVSDLSKENEAILRSFLEKGGKLVAFYQLSPELMKALGFDKTVYFKPDAQNDSLLAEVRVDETSPFFHHFDRADSFEQKSWNICVSKPSTEGATFRACVGAWWFDASGKKTEYPALLLSDRGAFFSHVLTDDGFAEKSKFLSSLFRIYDEPLMRRQIISAWRSLFAIGDMRKLTDVQREEMKTRYVVELKKRGLEVSLSFFDELENDRTLDGFGRSDLLLKSLHEMRDEEMRRYVKSLPSRSPEFRAWWEHAGYGAYPGDWDRTMRELSEAGFNAILPNMIWGGAAFYESDLLPTDPRFAEYGDQVRQAVEAGKKHGVEVHVWKVNYRLSRAPKEFVEKMRSAGRLQKTRNGKEEDWLCPSHPANIELEWKSMCEVVQKYDVAGIHFDYIRYSNSDLCFCDGCRERFSKAHDITIKSWPEDVIKDKQINEKWLKWRCDNISKVVEATHREAKKIRSGIRISAAVFRDYPDVLTGVAQDWKLWTEKGWLDFLCPMDYTENMDRFEAWLTKQTVISKIPVYPGIGAASSRTTLTSDQVAAQIEMARAFKCEGFVIFNLNPRTIKIHPPVLHLGPTKEKVPTPKP